MFPDFMDALVPIASQPGPMSGRNWMQRRINFEDSWFKDDSTEVPDGDMKVEQIA